MRRAEKIQRKYSEKGDNNMVQSRAMQNSQDLRQRHTNIYLHHHVPADRDIRDTVLPVVFVGIVPIVPDLQLGKWLR